MELTRQEGRVLGCLVEKQLTTPQQYPLTENALIAACNQTTNRDPVVTYDVSTVRIASRSLREKGLLRMVHRTGERSDKHQHLLDGSLDLSPGQVSLLAVLLLRGPQTLAELRARSERMHPFETVTQVQEALDALTDRDEPLVALLERQPGRKEARYGQLLVEVGQARATPLSDQGLSDQGSEADGLTLAGLAREVGLLRAEVAGLRSQVGVLGDAKRIYHLTTRTEWDEAQAAGMYSRSTRGRSFDEVGFIHGSLPSQLTEVAELVYDDCQEDLVVLVMDLDTLNAGGLTVRFEDGGNGTFYPHINAPLPCRLVDDVRPASFDERGHFVFAG